MATHGPAPSGSCVVIVSITLPANSSASEGEYVVISTDESEKVPVPDVVQIIEDTPPTVSAPSVV